MATVSYMGKGTVYFGVGANPLVSIGNVSKLSLSIAEDKQEMMDYESGGGGTADSISRIKSVSMDMTGYSFSQENLALAVRGTSAAVTGGAVTDEAVEAVKGGLNTLAKIPDMTQTLTVEKGVTTFVEGTDYVRTRSGFTIPTGSTIVDGDDLLVTYTALASNTLQGLTTGAEDVVVLFEGLNEARSGKAVIIKLFRVQFSPTSGLDLIGDKFGEINLNGTLLKDESITGVGRSQYMTVTMVA